MENGRNQGESLHKDSKSRRSFLQFMISGSLFRGLDILSAQTIRGGNKLWDFKTEGQVRSSPSVGDGTVYVGSGYRFNPTDTRIYALKGDSGLKEWSYDTGEYIQSSPAIEKDTVYIGNAGGDMFSFGTNSGDNQWQENIGGRILSSLVISDGSLYFGTLDSKIYSLDAQSGDEQWSINTVITGERSEYKPNPVRSSPVIIDNTIYIGSGYRGIRQGNSFIYALDTQTGTERWRYETDKPVESSPTLAEEAVVVGCADNYLYALNKKTGEIKWRFETNGSIHSSPTIADETVFVGSEDGNLYAVDLERGEEQWHLETASAIYSSPSVAGNVVFVGSDDGGIYAVSVTNGELHWRYETEGQVRSSPIIVNGILFVGSNDEKIYAIDAGINESSRGSRAQLNTLGHHGRDTQITYQPASFEIKEVNTNSPVVEGRQVNLTVEVQNTGQRPGRKSIDVRIEGLARELRDIELDAQERMEVNFSFNTEIGDNDDYLAIIDSGDETVTERITVSEANPYFAMEDVRLSQNELTKGDEFDIIVSLENVGEIEGTQSIRLFIGDDPRKVQTVSLPEGQTSDVIFDDISTDNLEPGNYTIIVRSDNDEFSGSVFISPRSTPSPTPSSPPEQTPTDSIESPSTPNEGNGGVEFGILGAVLTVVGSMLFIVSYIYKSYLLYLLKSAGAKAKFISLWLIRWAAYIILLRPK